VIERDRIIEAAYDEVAEKGIAATSLETVAERAGTEVASVRALFVDKQALFDALMHEVADPLMSAVAVAAQDAKGPEAMLRTSLRVLDEFLLEHPRFTRLMLWALMEGDESLEKFYRNSYYPSEFFERIETFIKEGSIRCKDVFTFTMIIEGLIFYAHMLRPAIRLMMPDVPEDQILEQRLEATLDVLVHGLVREPSTQE
jgi:AcrR family transcriptional regulator